MIAPRTQADRRRRARRRDDRLENRVEQKGGPSDALRATRAPDPTSTELVSPLGALSTAETADCACPEFCERDHDNE